jgi:hypothetical protein
MSSLAAVKALLAQCPPEIRRQVFDHLRPEFRIHPLEDKLNVEAEVILGAIARASDLTIRGIRGIIAEAAWIRYEVPKLVGVQVEELLGDLPYDFLVKDPEGQIKIQVKLQRQEKQIPLLSDRYVKRLKCKPGQFIVETQKTRKGTDKTTQANTRPYHFGEFDILCVSLQPSLKSWHSFMYTVGSWLVPKPTESHLLETYQPVAPKRNEFWTDDIMEAIAWFRSGEHKRIR